MSNRITRLLNFFIGAFFVLVKLLLLLICQRFAVAFDGVHAADVSRSQNSRIFAIRPECTAKEFLGVFKAWKIITSKRSIAVRILLPCAEHKPFFSL